MQKQDKTGIIHIQASDIAQAETVRISAEYTSGEFVIVEKCILSGQKVTASTTQAQITLYVLEGDVTAWQDSTPIFQAQTGDILHLPATDTTYSYEQTGMGTGRLLELCFFRNRSQQLLHIPAGDGRSLRVLTDIGTFKLTGKQTQHTYLLMLWLVPPSGGAAMHAQRGQETFYILDGSFALRGRRSGEEQDYTLQAGKGDVIHIPERVPHAYQNTGDTSGLMLVVFTPSGKTQRFFEEMGTPVTDFSRLPPPSFPDPAKLMSLLQKYEVDVFL